MSEKLRRCRKELSESISRALEHSGLQYFIHLYTYHWPAEYMKSVPTKGIISENVVSKPFCALSLENLPSHPPDLTQLGQHSLSLDLEHTPTSTISSVTESYEEDITGTLLQIIDNTSSRVMAEIYETVEREVDLSIVYGLCPQSPSYGAAMLSLNPADEETTADATHTSHSDHCTIIEMVLDMEQDYCHQIQTWDGFT
ncbi:hypothetical protein XELAEV_18023801mg [Xenopus laevis]|uniref:Uncharacterized protein n=1 Tax=Xenopus laevis TaxID=8355 RepID=A0A974D6Q6_XENLA|nr:hypothetical protein XELAEV_18023801mg [Xenopus laevis]